MNTDLAFDADLLGQIRERFENVESNPFSGERIYFESAGGTQIAWQGSA
jgi:hypothetical protein